MVKKHNLLKAKRQLYKLKAASNLMTLNFLMVQKNLNYIKSSFVPCG